MPSTELDFSPLALRDAIGSWYPLLSESVIKQTVSTVHHVRQLRENGAVIYPPQSEVFRAARMTQPEQVKCVILGQDPYHGPGQANGLAFSVPAGCRLPPSLRNIYKELAADVGCAAPQEGDLSHWARQGVLLLNSVLTVEEGKPGSHGKLGWQLFTQELLRAAFRLPQPIVFLLWGKYAWDTAGGVYNEFSPPPAGKKLILAAHPSPLSAYRGFFGSCPFSQANRYLQENGAPPVQWEEPT